MTKSKPEGRELQMVTIAVADPKLHKDAFEAARGAANGIEFAREVANLPPNLATPTRLGQEAKGLAKAYGFQCEVMGPKEIAKIGMGSFLSVAKGSEEPARFIVMQYQGGGKNDAPVVLEVRSLAKSFWLRQGVFGNREFKAVPERTLRCARGGNFWVVMRTWQFWNGRASSWPLEVYTTRPSRSQPSTRRSCWWLVR